MEVAEDPDPVVASTELVANPSQRRPLTRYTTHCRQAVKVIEKLKTQELKTYCWVRIGKGITGPKWKYRWFELRRGRLIIKRDEESEETGKEPFILINETTQITRSSKVPPSRTNLFGFKISSNKGMKYHLAAPSKKSFEDWMKIIESVVDNQTQISLTDQLHYLQVYAPNSDKFPVYPILDVQVLAVVCQKKPKISIGVYHGNQRVYSWPVSANDSLNFGCTFMFPIKDFVQASISTLQKKRLGDIRINISRLAMNQMIDDWFPIRNAFGDITALLHLRLHKTQSRQAPILKVPEGVPSKGFPLRLGTGDVLLWQNLNLGSIGTSLVTSSSWNHVGMIVKWPDNTFKVLQATATGVTLDMLDNIIAHAQTAQVAALAVRKFTTDQRELREKLLYKFITEVEGRPFTSDIFTFIQGLFKQNTHEDEASFFCSHLVGAAFVAMQVLQDQIVCTNFLPRHWSTFNSFLGITELSEKYIFSPKSFEKESKPTKHEYSDFFILNVDEFNKQISKRPLDDKGREEKLASWQEWDLLQKTSKLKRKSSATFHDPIQTQAPATGAKATSPPQLQRRKTISDLRSLSVSKSSEDSHSKIVSHHQRPLFASDEIFLRALGNYQREASKSIPEEPFTDLPNRSHDPPQCASPEDSESIEAYLSDISDEELKSPTTMEIEKMKLYRHPQEPHLQDPIARSPSPSLKPDPPTPVKMDLHQLERNTELDLIAPPPSHNLLSSSSRESLRLRRNHKSPSSSPSRTPDTLPKSHFDSKIDLSTIKTDEKRDRLSPKKLSESGSSRSGSNSHGTSSERITRHSHRASDPHRHRVVSTSPPPGLYDHNKLAVDVPNQKPKPRESSPVRSNFKRRSGDRPSKRRSADRPPRVERGFSPETKNKDTSPSTPKQAGIDHSQGLDKVPEGKVALVSSTDTTKPSISLSSSPGNDELASLGFEMSPRRGRSSSRNPSGKAQTKSDGASDPKREKRTREKDREKEKEKDKDREKDHKDTEQD